MNEQRKKIRIGGLVMDPDLTGDVLDILKGFDRMPDNPDYPLLQELICNSLSEEGLLRLIVFVCPKFDTQALLGKEPEFYIPVKANGSDLFEPRIQKIMEVRDRLFKKGIVSTVEAVIGDNDFETYILPFITGITWNSELAAVRAKEYERSFAARLGSVFGILSNTWSLSGMEVSLSNNSVTVSKEQLFKEVKFLEWLFSMEGPYNGKLTFGSDQLIEMAKLKFSAYGAQGEFLEQLGGILMQSEGPGVWLQRTMMLRCSDSKAVPAIYPWIRREEVITIKNENA